MCGIVGIFDKTGRSVDASVLVSMRDALAHRGADGSGVYINGSVGLGHRRLAIIDLSEKAAQPMVSPDGRYVIIYNGETYNYIALRNLLAKAGWQFKSHSDTEVILAGCIIWGVKELACRINGMAAFAFWDKVEEKIALVRDRHGTKPLYLWRNSKQIIFASEIKAFLKHPDFKVCVNTSALREYFTFQNLFRSHTLFSGVEQLPPGSILNINQKEEKLEKYWDYKFLTTENTYKEGASTHLEHLMEKAVERQLVSDVPVGAYLSGGLDSGSIVAIASRHVPRIQTFTAGFELSAVDGFEAAFDERRSAEMMAYLFKSEHYEQVMNSGDIRWTLPSLVWHLEDLRLGMSYPNYNISRLASKFVKVCLSGAGGDELFGGYPWRYYRIFRSLDKNHFLENYFEFWQRLTTPKERKELFQDDTANDDEMFSVFCSVFPEKNDITFGSPEEQINASLYFECRTFLQGLLLVGDRLSMANGLEERFPFLDNDVVDFAMQLPVSEKLSDLKEMLKISEDQVRKKLIAQDSFSHGKSCLREAMAHLLPSEIMNAKKQGFSSPEASWYRGENAEYVRDMLQSKNLMSAEYLNREYIDKIIEEHMSQKHNHRLKIWSFLCFEQWCRVFL